MLPFAAILSDLKGSDLSRYRSLALLCLWLCLFGTCGSSQAQLLFSEIHYHPVEYPEFDASGHPLLDLSGDVHEFVEIHNTGSETVALAGYRITGGIQFTFPEGAMIEPGGYRVIARDPERLAALDVYGLEPSDVLGPYSGRLSNSSDVLRLRDADNALLDWVEYSDSFPWALAADALGANERFTGILPPTHQYLGRSLERVSFTHDSTDPANWVASPLDGTPSPGRVNSSARDVPKPIVVEIQVQQESDGSPVLREGQPVRIHAAFSAETDLSNVEFEYHIWSSSEDLPVSTRIPMNAVLLDERAWHTVLLPGFNDRELIRYRIVADRGDGSERVSPRPDDPMDWHGFFITPQRTEDWPHYDIFISDSRRSRLASNVTQNPRRVTNPDPPGHPRESWNATEPALFVHDNVVYDVHIRHRGSRWNRRVDRHAYKVHFPRYARLQGQSAILLTDKGDDTTAAHALFRALDIPTSRTQRVQMQVNNDTVRIRQELEVNDGRMLERFRAEQRLKYPDRDIPSVGEIYKSRGLDTNEGPYGRGDGSLLPQRSIWTPMERFQWTYNLKNNDWKGHAPFVEMLEGMWAARNGRTSGLGDEEIRQLREYFEAHWNVDKMLSYIAMINWLAPWDDIFHNYFIWRDGDGKWCLLPWDFDFLFRTQDSNASLFAGEVGDPSNNFRGHNYFKDSFIKAYRDEIRDRFFLLNNTVLAPEHIGESTDRPLALGFARARQGPVNDQVGLGAFYRPGRPAAQYPDADEAVVPPVELRTAPYAHDAMPLSPHRRTTWLVWEDGSSPDAPIFRRTSGESLTSVEVPAALLALGKRYYWQAIHEDASGHPSVPSEPASFYLGAAPEFEPGDVVINEFLAVGRNAIEHFGEHPDWIELYNTTSNPMDLGGWWLIDDIERPDRFVFPDGTLISPGGHLVVWCTDPADPAGLYADFALSRDGELVALYKPSENGHQLVDLIVFGRQLEDLSLGRIPDGHGEWRLNVPTPGGINENRSTGSSQVVRINEWMAAPLEGEDWIELFNPQADPVDLGNHFITDRLDRPDRSQIPPHSFMPGQGYWVLIADGNPERGASHVGFSLSANGEAIGLYTPEGLPIDELEFGPQTSGVSQGRFPDGAETIVFFPETPSPGAPNFLPGTGPSDHKLSVERSSDPGADALELRFQGIEGSRYQLQHRALLEVGEWQNGAIIGPLGPDAVATWVWQLDGGTRFFRVVELP